jgi:hypothetical protein
MDLFHLTLFRSWMNWVELKYDHAKDKIESFSEFVKISAQTAKKIKYKLYNSVE